MSEVTVAQFDHWLKEYGAAWEAKNAEKFATLFEDDALYYWTPFDPPKKGREQIRDAFSHAVATQTEIDFAARVLSADAPVGTAHWQCVHKRVTTGKRVTIDGIFVVQFGVFDHALLFREWWHSDEHK